MSKMRLISTIMENNPELCDFGFGSYGGLPASDKDKDDLRKSEADVIRTGIWIDEHLGKKKGINGDYTSYGLKHFAEQDIGYITNGVFIAAMIDRGFRFRRSGPNAQFNVTQASVNRLYRRENRIGEYAQGDD